MAVSPYDLFRKYADQDSKKAFRDIEVKLDNELNTNWSYIENDWCASVNVSLVGNWYNLSPSKVSRVVDTLICLYKQKGWSNVEARKDENDCIMIEVGY